MEQRAAAALASHTSLGFPFPAVVDEMNDKVGETYDAWPVRLYIVDKKGRIVYKSEEGPEGFNTMEMGQRLRKICST